MTALSTVKSVLFCVHTLSVTVIQASLTIELTASVVADTSRRTLCVACPAIVAVCFGVDTHAIALCQAVLA